MAANFERSRKQEETTRHRFVSKQFFSIVPLEKQIDNELNVVFGVSTLAYAMKKATEWNYVMYSQELISISKATGIHLGKLTMMQLMYEMCACCTSVVVNNSQTGHPMHIRRYNVQFKTMPLLLFCFLSGTMDWDADFLKDLTIELEFIKKGKPIAIVTTWLGYVGVFTGMRLNSMGSENEQKNTNGYTVSLNFRRSDRPSLWTNIVRTLRYEWPVGFLIRHVLETVDSMDEAFLRLARTRLVAPCYLILSGCGPNDGILIVRDRDGPVSIHLLEDHPIATQREEEKLGMTLCVTLVAQPEMEESFLVKAELTKYNRRSPSAFHMIRETYHSYLQEHQKERIDEDLVKDFTSRLLNKGLSQKAIYDLIPAHQSTFSQFISETSSRFNVDVERVCIFLIYTYNVIGGTKTRSETKPTLKLASEHALIQTNVDYYNKKVKENILWSVQRFHLAQLLLRETQGKIDEESLWNLTNAYPIRNEETIYTTLMCVASSTYETRVNTKHVYEKFQ